MLQFTHQAGLGQFVVDGVGRAIPPAHDINRLTMTPCNPTGKTPNTPKQKHHPPTNPLSVVFTQELHTCGLVL